VALQFDPDMADAEEYPGETCGTPRQWENAISHKFAR